MTEHIRKRAQELADETGLTHKDHPLQRAGYECAMLRTLPIIERLMNGEHDEGCAFFDCTLDSTGFYRETCNCTLGKAMEEARKLVGG